MDKINKMYGVDKCGHIYLFDIISEYSDEIIVKMTNQSIYLQSVEFYIKQQENSIFYTITNCSDPKCYLTTRDYEIIISKCKEDIIAKRYSIINKYYDNKIKEQEDLIKNSTDMLNDLNSSYNRLSLNNLELNDKIILLCDNEQYEGTVTSLVTKDKINFTPRISCEEMYIEDAEIELDEDSDDPKTNILKMSYDYYDYNGSVILVFLDDTDLRNYRNYLSFKKFERFKECCEHDIIKLRNKRDNEIKNIDNF
jgi:molybdopterin converting factor small subunit